MAEELEIQQNENVEETVVEETTNKVIITVDFSMDPIERLKFELENSKENLEKTIGPHLIEVLKKDETLASAYHDRKITLKDVCKYLYKCAKEFLKSVDGGIDGDTLMGWAIHYIQDEPVKITEDNSYVLSEEDKEAARKSAMWKFEQEQILKLREAEEKKQKDLQKKIAKEDKKREESGQMSIFDFGDGEK